MTTSTLGAYLTPPVHKHDHIQGRADAPITLVVFGDYTSPDSARAYHVIKDLQDRFGDRLCFVFRSFPTAAHPFAQQAAEAAEEAGVQGQFWPMYDHLFAHQWALDGAHLSAHAHFLELDMAAFQAAMTDHRHAARVAANVASGIESGVTRTPTFFINGVRHDGPIAIDSLLDAIRLAEHAVAGGSRWGIDQGPAAWRHQAGVTAPPGPQDNQGAVAMERTGSLVVVLARYDLAQEAEVDLALVGAFVVDQAVNRYDVAMLVTDAWAQAETWQWQVQLPGTPPEQVRRALAAQLGRGGPGQHPPVSAPGSFSREDLNMVRSMLPQDAAVLLVAAETDESEGLAACFPRARVVDWSVAAAAADGSHPVPGPVVRRLLDARQRRAEQRS